ncbi:uncharacterized protein LOC127244529 isoform X2 [Andrographis paniculata]|uniref:uncharacterized protein LOC127244529 isoform X2 n=1 Tax=Andrographis paniculata TaxID=175694 RepID=UPI0021E6DD99|nr:uncharacterized protein LOC127244529 isoform X2 [Andrographis paniculata]
MKFLLSVVPRSDKKISLPSRPVHPHGDCTPRLLLNSHQPAPEFTPSRGSTPVHHSFSLGNGNVNLLVNKGIGNPSPDKRKRLSELFEENVFHGEFASADNKGECENEAGEEAPARVVPEPTTTITTTTTDPDLGNQEPKSTYWESPTPTPPPPTTTTTTTPNNNNDRAGAGYKTGKAKMKAQCCLPSLRRLPIISKEKKKTKKSPFSSPKQDNH